MRYAKWYDPDENGNPIENVVSEEKAAEIMFSVADKLGKKYLSAEQAFIDFVVVNWAEIVYDDSVAENTEGD